VNLTTSSTFGTRKRYSIVSQLHHIIATKQFAAAQLSTTSNNNFTVLNESYIIVKKSNSHLLSLGTIAHESVTASNGALKTSLHDTNLKHENITV